MPVVLLFSVFFMASFVILITRIILSNSSSSLNFCKMIMLEDVALVLWVASIFCWLRYHYYFHLLTFCWKVSSVFLQCILLVVFSASCLLSNPIWRFSYLWFLYEFLYFFICISYLLLLSCGLVILNDASLIPFFEFPIISWANVYCELLLHCICEYF